MQVKCQAVNKFDSREKVLESMMVGLDQLNIQIFSAKKFLGDHLKLVVVPEYFMTSYPARESIQEWREKACITKDDPIFDKIADICRKNQVYFSGNYYEIDEKFQDLFFQSSFIMNDKGEMILNYRRLNSMYSPTPHDVLNKYIEVYGYESLFPVVDTPLGKLACIASEEILYPEVARCLMMRGAEVFLHSSSEIGSPTLTKKNIAKQARAIENMCYVVSANSAGIKDIGILESSTDGGSKVINYEGIVLAETLPGESIVAHAAIHIPALRIHRETISMKNYIARQRFELYAQSYAEHSHYPANSLDGIKAEKSLFKSIQEEVIKKLSQDITK